MTERGFSPPQAAVVSTQAVRRTGLQPLPGSRADDHFCGREKEERPMSSYQVRRVNIGKTIQLDELAHECGFPMLTQRMRACRPSLPASRVGGSAKNWVILIHIRHAAASGTSASNTN